MNLDIRLPIGLLFACLGGLLLLYGLATHFTQPAIYERSLGVNINLWWGLVMLLFGADHDLAWAAAARAASSHDRLIEEPRRCRACRWFSPPRP